MKTKLHPTKHDLREQTRRAMIELLNQQLADILDLGLNQKVLNRSGAWFKYGETYLGQGKEKARAFLQENPQVTAELREKILSSGSLSGGVASESAEAE